MAEIHTDTPDTRPGFYYVSVRRDGGDRGGYEYRMLRGPFPTHAEALAAVSSARNEAQERDPRAAWYAFGTARSETDIGPGILDRAPNRTETGRPTYPTERR